MGLEIKLKKRIDLEDWLHIAGGILLFFAGIYGVIGHPYMSALMVLVGSLLVLIRFEGR